VVVYDVEGYWCGLVVVELLAFEGFEIYFVILFDVVLLILDLMLEGLLFC